MRPRLPIVSLWRQFPLQTVTDDVSYTQMSHPYSCLSVGPGEDRHRLDSKHHKLLMIKYLHKVSHQFKFNRWITSDGTIRY